MEAIDDDGVDVNRLCTEIIYGVMHHPAQRDGGDDGAREGRQMLFKVVEDWWNEKRREQDDYRRKLSREGVQNGENHKEGVHDTGHGHGCVGTLKMRKQFGKPETMEDRIAGTVAGHILEGATGQLSGMVKQQTGVDIPTYRYQQKQEAEEEQGFGGGVVGGLLGKVVGGAFGGGESTSQSSRRYEEEGGYEQQSSSRYEQQSSSRYEQQSSSRYEQKSRYEEQGEEEQGGYARKQERRYGESEDSGYGQSQRRDDNEEEGGGGFGDILDTVRKQAEGAFGGGSGGESRRW
jgi:uncharacterized protein YcfJ